MSFGEGDLHARVEQLLEDLDRAQGTCESFADENVELHGRVEQLERENEELRAEMERRHGNVVRNVGTLLKDKAQLGREKEADMADLRKVNAQLLDRIGKLESLNSELWEYLDFCCVQMVVPFGGKLSHLKNKMAALGLGVD